MKRFAILFLVSAKKFSRLAKRLAKMTSPCAAQLGVCSRAEGLSSRPTVVAGIEFVVEVVGVEVVDGVDGASASVAFALDAVSPSGGEGDCSASVADVFLRQLIDKDLNTDMAVVSRCVGWDFALAVLIVGQRSAGAQVWLA